MRKSANTGAPVRLDTTFRRSEKRRARGHALGAAYLALASTDYDRDSVLFGHGTLDGHTTRVSLAELHGSSFRLGVVRCSMRRDGSAAIASFDIEDVAAADKPGLVRNICVALGLIR